MSEKVATRDAYGDALVKLGESNPRVVLLDANPSKSAQNVFAVKFPERFFQMGIAEADMISTAAGLAARGKIPFTGVFAGFAGSQAYDRLRKTAAYSRLNVKIAATHGGLGAGDDGVLHQDTEDITFMRAIPGMAVLNPADGVETERLVFAAAAYPGPVYIRLGREPVSILFSADYQPEIGKANRIKEGKAATIVATGIMVEQALQAAEILAGRGSTVRVLDMHTIQPLDTAEIIKAAWETGAIVTAEEHSVIGGLAGAVAEVVVQNHPVPMEFIGSRDLFSRSETPAEPRGADGLNTDHLVAAVEKAIERKRS